MGRKFLKSSGLKDDFFTMGVRRAYLNTSDMTDSPRDGFTTLVITGRIMDRCCSRSHGDSGSRQKYIISLLNNLLNIFFSDREETCHCGSSKVIIRYMN